ncbi:thiosulfate/3-mercaptopyruvate sulfurtransferase [Paenibacillus sophorae]|uniref:Sulfurtransferase n=1 Tax=Paenibacillus sophorae TaxID=1333845 RepID=A0A1H8K663_9BACL|nr:sulfurtransferase [Paenibacillus sophorae]QWU13607.1 sulfurtransferase [Paenibacillus sophorae]SEN87878.1 thiosulfate/3-mercaptopyruvate sulfurtransferase [Paenibacillus sophorae]
MDSVVSTRWLLARMYEPELVIADCRFLLSDPEAGRSAYLKDHIPGAVYLHLEEQLSAPVGPHGGRHPLPEPAALASVLGQAGINRDSIVVAYDDQGGAFASRLWWMLRYLGHDKVFVMDEGYSAWKAADFPVSDSQPFRVPTTYEPEVHPEMLASVEEVRKYSQDGGPSVPLLIDSREPRRYAGLEESIDAKAGHIPGAVNRFWKDVLDEQGRWKDAAALKEKFADIDPSREVIVYCGSGVTACPNVLALQRAGYDKVRLYAGSWSDWISYEENPVATGEE